MIWLAYVAVGGVAIGLLVWIAWLIGKSGCWPEHDTEGRIVEGFGAIVFFLMMAGASLGVGYLILHAIQ